MYRVILPSLVSQHNHNVGESPWRVLGREGPDPKRETGGASTREEESNIYNRYVAMQPNLSINLI